MRKLMTFSAVLVVAILLCTACNTTQPQPAAATSAPTEQSASPKQENKRDDLVIGVMGEPLGLVPELTNDGYSTTVEYQVYSGLLTFNDQKELVGDLAESWQISDDLMTYTFKLRPNITFHNGEKLTADDVKFTFDLGMSAPQVADLFGVFKAVEVVDPSTVKVTLKQPYTPVLEKLSQPNTAGIICKKTYEEIGKDAYTSAPVGTGAYKLSSWEKGVKLVLERFDQYHNGPAPIKTVTMRFIPDATTATISMQTGEIDMTSNVSLVDLKTLDKSKISVYEAPSTHLNWLAINTSVKPFDNALVRKAMEFAINKDEVITAAMEGHGTKAETVAFAGIPGYSAEVGGNDFDIQKSKDLLAEAGYPDGFETDMLTLSGYPSAVAEIIQSNLSQVGITVTIQNMETSAFLQDVTGGNFRLSFLASDSNTYDPEQIYQRLHPKGAYSVSKYDNSKLNGYLETILTEIDKDKRGAAVVETQKIIKDEVPLIPLFWRNNLVIANSSLKNVDKTLQRFELYRLSW